MSAPLARAIMAVAAACLGEGRRDWARAMEAELHAAIDEGRPLAFAAGCLIAAWCEMPRHEEGRFVLANYALALGLIIPMAALQFACAAGLPLMVQTPGGFYGVPTANGVQQLYLSSAYPSAEPALLGLWLLLGLLQLRLAWVLLDGDWPGVIRIGCLSTAATATLMIFYAVMLLPDTGTMLQAAALPVELATVLVSARWHSRLAAALSPDAESLIAS